MSEGMSASQQGEFVLRSWTWQYWKYVSLLIRRMCCVLGVTLRWYAHWTFVLYLCSHRDAGTFNVEECVLGY